MTLLLGKDFNSQCDCSDYIVLIVVGAAALVACVLQLVALFVFGPTAAPRPTAKGATVPPSPTARPDSTKTNVSDDLSRFSRTSNKSTTGPSNDTNESAPFTALGTAKNNNTSKDDDDSGLPSWMNA